MTENSTGRKECTRQLSAMLERHIDPRNDPRIYWAKEVTFDYSTNHKIRVDYMRFQPLNNTTSGIEKGDFYAYEVKSSVEDFKSPNGHNFSLLEKAPTVVAVPVVRCEGCVFSQSDGWVCGGTSLMPQHRTFPNSFCSDGERKNKNDKETNDRQD